MVTKLEQHILDEQKQLDELIGKPEEKLSEELVDEVIAEKEPEENPEEIIKSEGSEEERTKRENDERAKERINKREARKKLELENAQLKGYVAATQEITNKTQVQSRQETPKDIEPDKDLDPDAHLRWELRKERTERLQDRQELQQLKLQTQIGQAKSEVRDFEDAYKATDPDYDSAKEFLIKNSFEQIKAANPGISDAMVKREVERLELVQASIAVKMGDDPAFRFKMLAVKNGWKPEPKDDAKEEKKSDRPKLDLKTLETNKRKSANLIGGSSRGKVGDPDTDDVVGMTLLEMAKIEDSYWKRV